MKKLMFSIAVVVGFTAISDEVKAQTYIYPGIPKTVDTGPGSAETTCSGTIEDCIIAWQNIHGVMLYRALDRPDVVYQIATSSPYSPPELPYEQFYQMLQEGIPLEGLIYTEGQ